MLTSSATSSKPSAPKPSKAPASKPATSKPSEAPKSSSSTPAARTHDTYTPPASKSGAQRAMAASKVQQVGQTTYDQAVQNQRELSQARIELGQAQTMVEQCQDDPRHLKLAQQQLDAAQARVTQLEQVESTLPQDDVEKARFVVFGERMAELEKQYGTPKAVEMARQVYYNGGPWAEVSGAPPLTDAQINLLGLPHGARHPDGNGGFLGEMRTPDGQRIDMGHVMCAVDFQVNASRQPATLSRGPITIDNPFNPNTTTLMGDLATAILYRGDPSHWVEAGANQNAVAGEGNSDWRGDIDGLNLAHRMSGDPPPTFSEAFQSYYGGDPPPSQSRVDELATHSPYFARDENGQPVRDASGRYQVDTGKMAGDGASIAVMLNPGQVINANLIAGQVAGAFSDWLEAERLGQHGVDDR